MANTTTNNMKLTQRLDALEQQLTTTIISDQNNEIATPATIKKLQNEATLIKKLVFHNIPALRQEIATLQAQVQNNSNQNQLPIRSHDEKLQSALKNANLIRIATGVSLPGGLSIHETYTREADELESLASKLRVLAGKVKVGGTVYTQEAEDAEALAVKLRGMALEVAQTPLLGLQQKNGSIQEPGSGVEFESDVEVESDVEIESDIEARIADSIQILNLATASGTATNEDEDDDIVIINCNSPNSDLRKEEKTDTSTQISTSTLTTTSWQPHIIRSLEPLHPDLLAEIPSPENTVTFSKDFLLTQLNGTLWSPGFYYVPTGQPSFLPNCGFWLLDSTHEPLMPTAPGSHGCTVTPLLRRPNSPAGPERNAYRNAPVFLTHGTNTYTYQGMYSICRGPDRLDHDHSRHIPPHVKGFWAQELCHRRAPWQTLALKRHLCAAPPSPSRPDINALTQHIRDMGAWDRDAELRLSGLQPADVELAFEEPDAETIPGLRFWVQYLRCVDWDRGFYDVMVKLQREGGEAGPEMIRRLKREDQLRDRMEREWRRAYLDRKDVVW